MADVPRGNEKIDRKAEITPMFGIDLGTSESRMSVWKDGEVKLLPNWRTEKTFTSSYVTFMSNKRGVGEFAKTCVGWNMKNTVFDVKRLIGREVDDSSQPLFPLPFQVSLREGKVQVEVEKYKELKAYYPEDIMFKFLKRMLENAQEFMKLQVSHAVMTVPVYFNEAQREQATNSVARKSKIERIHVIDNPTAAAIAYCYAKEIKDAGLVLVYDLGTYTTEVSVMNVKDLHPEMVASSNNAILGGRNLDRSLLLHCLMVIMKKHNLDFANDNNSKWRLLLACEEAKKTLSSECEATIKVNHLCTGLNFNCKISRQEFDDMCTDKIRSTLKVVDQALSNGKLSKSEIKHVVLVGGSTRIPKVRETLRDHFQMRELDQSIPPEEIAVYGAAVYGALLNGTIEGHGSCCMSGTAPAKSANAPALVDESESQRSDIRDAIGISDTYESGNTREHAKDLSTPNEQRGDEGAVTLVEDSRGISGLPVPCSTITSEKDPENSENSQSSEDHFQLDITYKEGNLRICKKDMTAEWDKAVKKLNEKQITFTITRDPPEGAGNNANQLNRNIEVIFHAYYNGMLHFKSSVDQDNNEADEPREKALSVMHCEAKELREKEESKRRSDIARTKLETYVYNVKQTVEVDQNLSTNMKQMVESACCQMLDFIEENPLATKDNFESELETFQKRFGTLLKSTRK